MQQWEPQKLPWKCNKVIVSFWSEDLGDPGRLLPLLAILENVYGILDVWDEVRIPLIYYCVKTCISATPCLFWWDRWKKSSQRLDFQPPTISASSRWTLRRWESQSLVGEFTSYFWERYWAAFRVMSKFVNPMQSHCDTLDLPESKGCTKSDYQKWSCFCRMCPTSCQRHACWLYPSSDFCVTWLTSILWNW